MPQNLHGGEWTSLPAEVRALDQFLPWVVRPRSSGRMAKVPARRLGRGLYPVRADDPAAWLSFDAAQAEMLRGQAGGIGLCLPPALCVVDIDDVLHAGRLEPAVQALIDRARTWTEVSPSGHGVHLWFTTDAPVRSGRSGSLELLATGRFITITGQDLPGTTRTVVRLPDELSALFRGGERFRPPLQQDQDAGSNSSPDAAFLLALRHSDALRRLYLHGDTSGYGSPSEADLALCQLLHRWSGPNADQIDALFRLSALYRTKWESTRYRESTLALALHSGRWCK